MERRPKEKAPDLYSARAEVSASASVAGDGCRRRLLPSLYSPSYRFDCWAQPLMSPSPAASMSQKQMLHKPSLIITKIYAHTRNSTISIHAKKTSVIF
jgi:hypothetical protein